MNQVTETYLTLVRAYMGAPYIWRGKGNMIWTPKGLQPMSFEDHGVRFGFDCSGFVTVPLFHVTGVDVRATHNAERMRVEWPIVETKDVQPGNVALYGSPGHATHVMVVEGIAPTIGAISVVGASGGYDTTTRPEKNGFVKKQASFMYRPDFIGFRFVPGLGG